MLRGKRDVVRRSTMDIDNLGELGRELQLRARWESEGRAATGGEDVLGKLLGTGTDIASKLAGTRGRIARGIQRVQGGAEYATRLPEVSAAGSAVRPLQSREE